MPTNPRQRARLRLAPPAGELPDTRAAIAVALLDRYAPVLPPVWDHISHVQRGDMAAFRDLESDPKFLIGRLSQALSALLEPDVPPLDASATLLAQAVQDAIKYRSRLCPECPDESVCSKCMPNWHQGALYENLWRELGLIANLPPLPADLKAVSR
jgi:hypothetical protein